MELHAFAVNFVYTYHPCIVYIQEALEGALNDIDRECDRLCSSDNPTSFRKASAKELEKFSFDTLAADLQKTAPTVWSVLCTIATPTGKYIRKSADSHHPAECVIIAAAILLRERCVHMSATAYLIGLILWQGNASTKVRFAIQQT